MLRVLYRIGSIGVAVSIINYTTGIILLTVLSTSDFALYAALTATVAMTTNACTFGLGTAVIVHQNRINHEAFFYLLYTQIKNTFLRGQLLVLLSCYGLVWVLGLPLSYAIACTLGSVASIGLISQAYSKARFRFREFGFRAIAQSLLISMPLLLFYRNNFVLTYFLAIIGVSVLALYNLKSDLRLSASSARLHAYDSLVGGQLGAKRIFLQALPVCLNTCFLSALIGIDKIFASNYLPLEQQSAYVYVAYFVSVLLFIVNQVAAAWGLTLAKSFPQKSFEERLAMWHSVLLKCVCAISLVTIILYLLNIMIVEYFSGVDVSTYFKVGLSLVIGVSMYMASKFFLGFLTVTFQSREIFISPLLALVCYIMILASGVRTAMELALAFAAVMGINLLLMMIFSFRSLRIQVGGST